jgi:hypothetical protein
MRRPGGSSLFPVEPCRSLADIPTTSRRRGPSPPTLAALESFNRIAKRPPNRVGRGSDGMKALRLRTGTVTVCVSETLGDVSRNRRRSRRNISRSMPTSITPWPRWRGTPLARHLAEATYWLLSTQEAYREPQASAVSSAGEKRDFAIAPGSSNLNCDIPWNHHETAPTAKIWLRRNGLMLRKRASPTRIDRLMMTPCARALRRTNGHRLGIPPNRRRCGRRALTTQRFQIWRRTGQRKGLMARTVPYRRSC